MNVRPITLREAQAEARFMAKVSPEPMSGCWLWAGGMISTGYGQFKMPPRDSSPMLAHRLAWLWWRGDIAPGLFVCHKCDNRACVNPDHLFLGTNSENVADMLSKGRSLRGEAHPHSKLKAVDVLEIRRAAGDGVPHDAIAERFGIHDTHVADIVKRKRWGHL